MRRSYVRFDFLDDADEWTLLGWCWEQSSPIDTVEAVVTSSAAIISQLVI